MNRILAIVSALALSGLAFAEEPAKTEPAKTPAAAPAKVDTKATDSKKPAKNTKDNSKAQPKGRRGTPVNGSSQQK
jgi:hypothetical protein